MKKIALFLAVFLFLSGIFLAPNNVLAYQLNLVYSQKGDIQINNPETAQTFYDNLNGKPRDYFINSDKDFELYINLLVPEAVNRDGRYSAEVYSGVNKVLSVDGSSSEWSEFYDSTGRDYYLKGPEISGQMAAGKYKIEVYSKDNQGEYVLSVGKNNSYNILAILNSYWQIPLLKTSFFKTSVLQFFLTPFGVAGIGIIGAILILIFLLNYLISVIKQFIKHNQAKTLFLTSSGMHMKDDIVKLLQKPAYDVTVAFISTAAKPEENLDYLQKDWRIMRDDLGFNVEEVDIDGKTESEVFKLLELKDIIYVEGGNTFYLLSSMRKCNFEKVIKKLLKQGKVYIGASAGSIVAGKTIQTSDWKEEENRFGVKNLKGLGLVPFDIFCHYQPEHAEIIKQKMPDPKKRTKNLRILTDEQAILVQGNEVDLIGEGESIIV